MNMAPSSPETSATSRGAAPEAITVGRLHHAAEEAVLSSGMSWTVIRPATFMQNYLGHAAGIRKQGAFPSSHAAGRAPYLDVRDIAAVAAEALVDGAHAGKVSGGESLADPDIARLPSEVTGRKIGVVETTEEDACSAASHHLPPVRYRSPRAVRGLSSH
jgi:uncharacterized protein YbjT (DUF2867 family)